VSDLTDQVVDFYNALFGKIFFDPFRTRIRERRRRDAVERQIEEAASAASQSLERFLVSQQLAPEQAECILGGLSAMAGGLSLERIANPYTPPETIVEELLRMPACSLALEEAGKTGHATVYRVALHSVVQALMQIGPVMAEWQNIGFPATFELPKRIIARLNQISEQLGVLGSAGAEAADERYELLYRDYLAQRFYRVEVGTVRMTTNLSVDIRELFVMPNVLERSPEAHTPEGNAKGIAELMPLARAREFLSKGPGKDKKGSLGRPLLDHVLLGTRSVIVGAPGSGKSTFLEWLQLKIASAEQEFVLAGEQAIPLLLRVRQLDTDHLPADSGMIEKATASRDFANLMPPTWLHRQMSAGRVLFLLDGLDEADPGVRDKRILPWLIGICSLYPNCQFVVSSRPVGYQTGALRALGFSEAELLDFTEPQVLEYARHWCTAIRLARNEAIEEARREGSLEGDGIVAGFEGQPYIESLARNPLMLSAICLVNYFERGQLPKDRAVLYRLCVEGLVHNWDQRRGIVSEFSFEEKLRVTRELALEMQVDDQAEYEEDRVREVFARVLENKERATTLLEHIRYRSGLLLERRPGIFAYAHLTFQEYLAARAIHEGNRAKIEIEQLIREHADPRWQEVIALYCGVSPVPAARKVIEALVNQVEVSGRLIGDAYFCSGPEMAQDTALRQKVMLRIASSQSDFEALRNANDFSEAEFAPIANAVLAGSRTTTTAQLWLISHPKWLDLGLMVGRLSAWQQLKPEKVTELILLVHRAADDAILLELAKNADLYSSPTEDIDLPQAVVVWAGLFLRDQKPSKGVDAAIIQVLRAVVDRLPGPDSLFLDILPSYAERFYALGPEALQAAPALISDLIAKVRARGDGEREIENLEIWLHSLKLREESNEPQPAVH
jgi:hypothetical protein